jgi:hypothetical protein
MTMQRYNFNLTGLAFFVLAAVGAYFTGGWAACLLTVGALGCIKTGRLVWVTNPPHPGR